MMKKFFAVITIILFTIIFETSEVYSQDTSRCSTENCKTTPIYQVDLMVNTVVHSINFSGARANTECAHFLKLVSELGGSEYGPAGPSELIGKALKFDKNMSVDVDKYKCTKVKITIDKTPSIYK